jgi:hypothetical protein
MKELVQIIDTLCVTLVTLVFMYGVYKLLMD